MEGIQGFIEIQWLQAERSQGQARIVIAPVLYNLQRALPCWTGKICGKGEEVGRTVRLRIRKSIYIMVQLTVHVSVSGLPALYRLILMHKKGLKVKIVIFVPYKS